MIPNKNRISRIHTECLISIIKLVDSERHLKSIPGATYSVVPNLGNKSRSSFKKSSGIGTRAPLVDSRRFIASAGSVSPKPKLFCNFN